MNDLIDSRGLEEQKRRMSALSVDSFEELLEVFQNPEFADMIPDITRHKLPFLVSIEHLDQKEYEVLLRLAFGKIKEQSPKSKRRLVFADENAKVAYEISNTVRALKNLLPPEPENLDFRNIKLSTEDDERRGIHAVYSAGTVLGTGTSTVYRVPERSLLILRILEISYEAWFNDIFQSFSGKRKNDSKE